MKKEMSKLKNITEQLNNKSIVEQLKFLAEKFAGKIVFSTSFGLEDQLITHFIFSNNIPIEVFTLDTGRVFEETYKTLSKTETHYNKKIKIYFPDHHKVEKMVNEKGIYSMYESIENRKECCAIRKVEPLERALKDNECWLTGRRSQQSEFRTNLQLLEYDEGFKLFKYNPLYDWSLKEVKNEIKKNNTPYNILHDKGFISIGCSPCTRALKVGQNFREGRWWWEKNTGKECGIHVK